MIVMIVMTTIAAADPVIGTMTLEGAEIHSAPFAVVQGIYPDPKPGLRRGRGRRTLRCSTTEAVRMTTPPASAAAPAPASATAIPRMALALGIAGLIPFVGLAGIIVMNAHLAATDAWRALTLYGAVILSFMGGVHWGLAMARGISSGYVASVVPALVAWFSVAFLPPRPSATVLALGFAMLLLYDLGAVRRGEAPAWYATLRRWLTGIVLAALATALFATWR